MSLFKFCRAKLWKCSGIGKILTLAGTKTARVGMRGAVLSIIPSYNTGSPAHVVARVIAPVHITLSLFWESKRGTIHRVK
jgi:hypothetical protein